MDSSDTRVLVTGMPGRVGGVGSAIVDILRRRDQAVRALVLREDQRTDALRANGVDVVVGDLTQARDVAGALSGCRRMYFGMSVSPSYLEATATTAAVARERSDLEVLVNISQMTVSQMSLTEMTDSPHSGSSGFANKCSTGPDCPSSMSDPRFFSSIPFSRNERRNRLPGTRRFGCRLGPDAPRRSTRGMWPRSLHQFWSVQRLILARSTN
jgi:NAD(P)H-binding